MRNDRRAGSSLSFFNRSWSDFKLPFGDPTTQYWIGLDRLHELSQGECVIRFDVFMDGLWYYAQYTNFAVGDSSTNYTITLSGFSAMQAMVWWAPTGCSSPHTTPTTTRTRSTVLSPMVVDSGIKAMVLAPMGVSLVRSISSLGAVWDNRPTRRSLKLDCFVDVVARTFMADTVRHIR